ncbi:glutamyl-tRNA(Gln) amidotransferase, B subunit [Talaromyces stipitatus ATCC 10500]|uniref:Glutamyl-tRNA(Gln) amidotransferase subunit B, mitochondrial n=1 Tax=Talaromyces stipitatus (strain ATCC 10500 / CBS 375.48 / QM 6759 / NRRL 1006) TaxID=441959 RepID=GATB_TALSN|nr:glutamyl-tRNA(Gln) amidotransferase, B subunit [Talaromyces stipitatus ATCC 10500]B8M501.1 RecName: Full=Glutamyl-tRNA(Gln) amidotransferase subunit B, mitochondrial; Short=Glu-AdT subunit B; Flags: Precursor [Talaromyces stipitatus ATCC 10500]EED19436.1 glutamyl-tRNA(Gln) amidotransferase, B subunit [Talaromyces stipitatus ATCC 10500]
MPRLWYSRYLASARLRCRPLLISEQYGARIYQHLLRRTINTEANVQRPNDIVPLRKQLKEEAKRSKSQSRNGRGKKQVAANNEWELTVGIEIHAQLNSEAKLFSRAPTSTVAEPNSNVALFDLAFPGSQPEFQAATLLPALRAAIALNCEVQHTSRFDRKHYFYQDQPAGYQITQYYEPFARNGFIKLYDYDGIAPEDGKFVRIDIKQMQLEQDTAKSHEHPPSAHFLDFNRVSHPLIEIITMPQIHSPATAAACVRKIQAILQATSAVTTGMELGGLRADVNVSVRRRDAPPGAGEYYGVRGLGQRTEIKNLSSFKAVEDAIIAERDRQIRVLESGGTVEVETRGWSIGSTETRKLRSKEGEVDYRYMPDPDLHPLFIDDGLVSTLKENLPTLPDQLLAMLVGPMYGLSLEDAKPLVELDDGARLEYYQDVFDVLQALHSDDRDAAKKGLGRTAANWVLHELGALHTKAEVAWHADRIPAQTLAELIDQLIRKKITSSVAKQVLVMVFEGDQRPIQQLLEEENLLLRPLCREEYIALANSLIEENPQMVAQIREKNQLGKIGWFVGQMVRQGEKGRVEAQRAEEILRELILKRN